MSELSCKVLTSAAGPAAMSRRFAPATRARHAAGRGWPLRRNLPLRRLHSLQGDHSRRGSLLWADPTGRADRDRRLASAAHPRLPENRRLEGRDRVAPVDRGRPAARQGACAHHSWPGDDRRRQERRRPFRHRRAKNCLRASGHRDRLGARGAAGAAVRRRRPVLDRGAGADPRTRKARGRRRRLYRHGARHGLRQARRPRHGNRGAFKNPAAL